MWPLLLAVIALTSVCRGQVIVDTIYGQVEGHYVYINRYGFNVTSFLGVPFARAPVGDLRFEPPQPPIPWEGVFEADRLGFGCWQTSTLHWITHPGWQRYSEDCLNINIYAPANLDPTEPYPVMVYFYGGAFSSGVNIMYNGHYLAARDVIVVVPNYRIGVMGFSTTEDDVNPGNAGLYDQLATLQWVQDNIANFGGNPDQVTIFGQSAGAASTGHMVMSPLAKGLFHAVIQESGCESNFWSVNWPPQMPRTYTQQVAEKLGCDTGASGIMMNCLKSIEAEYVTGNQSIRCTPGSFCLGHAPVLDGTFLPGNPLELRERGEFADVPVLSGYNREDGSLYVFAYIPEALQRGFNRSEYLDYIYSRLLVFWEEQMDAVQLENTYQAMTWYYSPWPYINDLDLNREAVVDLVTDGAWTYTTDRMLRSHSTKADSYFYVFAYRSTNTSFGIWEGTEWAGVPHSGEIPYVWGWPLIREDPAVAWDSKIFVDIVDWNEEDDAYAEFFMDLFTNFAKTFNPTPEPVEAPGDLPDVTFPPFTDAEARYLLVDNGNISPGIDYRQQPSAFYREYLSYLTDIPMTQYFNNIEANKEPRDLPQGEGVDTEILENAINDLVERILQNAIIHEPVDMSDES